MSDVVPGICWSHSNLGFMTPSAPITTDTTVVFTSQIYSTSSFSPASFFFLNHLVFLLLDVAVTWNCYIYHFCLLLKFVNNHNVWLVSHWQFKPNRVLALSFSTTSGGISHFDFWTFNPYSAQMLLYTIPATWLWRSMYAVPASYTRYHVLDCIRGLFAQLAPGVQAGVVDPGLFCSWAAMISASKMSFRPASSNHWQGLSHFLILSVVHGVQRLILP